MPYVYNAIIMVFEMTAETQMIIKKQFLPLSKIIRVFFLACR